MGKTGINDLRGFKAIVCGGREYQGRDALFFIMDRLHQQHGFTMIVEGGARGADRFAREWAHSRGIHVATVDALWNEWPRRAGHIRNAAMLTLQPDLVIAFPGENGTKSMIEMARRAGVTVIEPMAYDFQETLDAMLESSEAAQEDEEDDDPQPPTAQDLPLS